MNRRPPESGHVLLLSVLVLGAIMTTTTVTVLQLGLGADRTSFALHQSHIARELAYSCAEEAIERLSRDSAYVGGDTLTIGTGECEVVAVSGSGDTDRTIQTTGTAGTITRKMQIEVADVGPPVDISSWQDVADF